MLKIDSELSEINISRTHAYHDAELIQIWLQNERPPVYESTVFHGVSCRCCERIRNPVLAISNKKKRKQGRKTEVSRI
jgi:hypothetical protein